MRLAIIALAGLAAGCTHVSTYRSQDLAAPEDDTALVGVSYAMPAIQYDIAVTRTLGECDDTGVPKLTVKADAKSSILPGERFELDPSDLSSIMKTSSVGLAFYDELGTLKSFNAAADDRTGDVLVDAVRVGVGIASATAGNPAGAIAAAADVQENAGAQAGWAGILKGMLPAFRVQAAEQPETFTLRCTAKARERLAALETAAGTLKTQTAALETLNARIDRRSSLAAFEGFDSKAMTELISLIDQQQAQVLSVEAAKNDVAKALKPLQVGAVYTWPTVTSARPPVQFPDGPAPFEPSESEVKALCENLVVSEARRGKECTAVLVAFGALTETRARLERDTVEVYASRGVSALVQPVNTRGANRGLLIREPVRGRLVVERLDTDKGQAIVQLGGAKAWSNILSGDPQWIPQIGPLRFLPFTSGPFENEALSVALRRDGRIETVNYETKDAAFARFSAAAAKMAGDYADASEKRETELRDDLKYAREKRINARADEIAVLTDEISRFEKSEALLKKRTGLSPEEEATQAQLVQLRSEIATLTAERDRIKLLQEIADLQAPKPAP